MSLLSRRRFFHTVTAATTVPLLRADEEQIKMPEAVHPVPGRSAVSLIRGEDRRRNVRQALEQIDDLIRPQLKRKKYVVIKPNNVSTVKQLAATHADALRGILEYLAPRFKGPVMIAESSAGNTMEGFDNFGYPRVAADFKPRDVRLVDLNAEGKYVLDAVLDGDLHVTPVRLAARLLDPDAFIICSAMLKTHNTVVATLSVKNMTLGAPLHEHPRKAGGWNDKRKYHGGVRQTHYGMMLTAARMKPFWGVTVIDGFEGMEGNGPSQGTPVESRLAIASTDYIAADRVGVEVMGVNPSWPGYLVYCWQMGLGQYDLNRIDVRGEQIAALRRKYQLHRDIERQLQWLGPMTELPPKLG